MLPRSSGPAFPARLGTFKDEHPTLMYTNLLCWLVVSAVSQIISLTCAKSHKREGADRDVKRLHNSPLIYYDMYQGRQIWEFRHAEYQEKSLETSQGFSGWLWVASLLLCVREFGDHLLDCSYLSCSIYGDVSHSEKSIPKKWMYVCTKMLHRIWV